MVLNDELWFPDPRKALKVGPLNGLVALGGDLSVPRLLLAYRSGIFPWSVDPITWWSPDPRGIFELNQFHISRSLARTLRAGRLHVTMDRAFGQVVAECGAPGPGRTSSWITPEFIDAYVGLHRAGHAHSAECWMEDRLVGGVYGVHIGGLFAGESMFHRVSDASKVALFHLIDRLRSQGFALFDIQITNEHTRQLGAISIPRDVYLERLAQAVKRTCRFEA